MGGYPQEETKSSLYVLFIRPSKHHPISTPSSSDPGEGSKPDSGWQVVGWGKEPRNG